MTAPLMHEDITGFGARAIRGLVRGLGVHLCDLKRDTAGAAVVVAALLFPAVVGGFGLGVEAGYQYMLQRELQHAAGVAAQAAGTRVHAGDTQEDIEAAALHVANEAGFPSSGTIVVSYPPDSPNTVEVMLTHSHARFFSSIFVDTPVSMGASAVAQVGVAGSAPCGLALSSSGREAVDVPGSTDLDRSGCEGAPNSHASGAFGMSESGPPGSRG